MKKSSAELHSLAARALERAGARITMAEAAARHLVRAEQQGLPTHGMSRVPFYVSMLKTGRADGRAFPRLAANSTAVCLVDNGDALPYESCALAIKEAIVRAKANGIGLRERVLSHPGEVGTMAGLTAPLTNWANKQQGGMGYVLLWLLGVPIPILILISLLRGCN